MLNIELENTPNWRYCNVRAGDKRPYPANWQQTPLELKRVESGNVGLLLGPVSGGVVALDFDGPSAWTWFDQTIGCPLPATPTWTSGKSGRCQMAFSVPSTYWFYLRTLKITHTRDDLIGEGEGFEFRWVGAQSVMPPSRLDDGRQYEWLTAPTSVEIAAIPEEILCYWLEHSNPERHEPAVRDLSQLSQADIDEVILLLDLVKQRFTQLDYDSWRTVAWATAHHVGPDVASVILPTYWPELKPGEYSRLFNRYNPEISPTIGSIRKLAGYVPPTEVKLTKLQLKLKQRYGINK